MHENHMMIILMIRTENKGWLCYCHMLLVSKKQKMEHATLKIRVGQKYTGSVRRFSCDYLIRSPRFPLSVHWCAISGLPFSSPEEWTFQSLPIPICSFSVPSAKQRGHYSPLLTCTLVSWLRTAVIAAPKEPEVGLWWGCDGLGQSFVQLRPSFPYVASTTTPKRIRGTKAVPQAGWSVMKRRVEQTGRVFVARLVYHRTVPSCASFSRLWFIPVLFLPLCE